MSSPILRGGNLVVTEQGVRDTVRQVLNPLWNSWYFFGLYANLASGDAAEPFEARSITTADHAMDRYVLTKLRRYVEDVTDQLDTYAIAEACETTRVFLDVVTNWYIRRSRERFWLADGAGVDETTRQPFDTLYTVLETVCRTVAPLLPLVTEEVWRGLTGGRSVHLADWPDVTGLPADDALAAAMDLVREVCSAGSSVRKAAGLRTRLPLAELVVAVDEPARLAGFEPIVSGELNVKSVRVIARDGDEAAGFGVSQRLTVHARVAGPRLGKDVQSAIRASKSGDWSLQDDGSVVAGGLPLHDGEYTLEQVAGATEGFEVAVLSSGGFVALDVRVGPELSDEGLARDLVRGVQQARRDAGLAVSDRIRLTISGDDDVVRAAGAHRELIGAETLATSLDVVTVGSDLDGAVPVEVTGARARVVLSRA